MGSYASVTIFFFYSHLGSNLFLEPYYSLHDHVIDDYSRGKRYDISNDVYLLQGSTFDRNLNISIKELVFYTFKKEEPFKKISNDIFSMMVHKAGYRKFKYYLEVMRIDSY